MRDGKQTGATDNGTFLFWVSRRGRKKVTFVGDEFAAHKMEMWVDLCVPWQMGLVRLKEECTVPAEVIPLHTGHKE